MSTTAQSTSASPFGQWLRAARTAAGMSQEKLATLSKLHRLQITYMETGRTKFPSAATVQRLAQVLGPPPAEALGARRPVRRVSRPHCAFCGVDAGNDELLLESTHSPRVRVCCSCVARLAAEVAIRARQRSRQRLHLVRD